MALVVVSLSVDCGDSQVISLAGKVRLPTELSLQPIAYRVYFWYRKNSFIIELNTLNFIHIVS